MRSSQRHGKQVSGNSLALEHRLAYDWTKKKHERTNTCTCAHAHPSGPSASQAVLKCKVPLAIAGGITTHNLASGLMVRGKCCAQVSGPATTLCRHKAACVTIQPAAFPEKSEAHLLVSHTVVSMLAKGALGHGGDLVVVKAPPLPGSFLLDVSHCHTQVIRLGQKGWTVPLRIQGCAHSEDGRRKREPIRAEQRP